MFKNQIKEGRYVDFLMSGYELEVWETRLRTFRTFNHIKRVQLKVWPRIEQWIGEKEKKKYLLIWKKHTQLKYQISGAVWCMAYSDMWSSI